MKKQVVFTALFLVSSGLFAQNEAMVTKLFQEASPLDIQLSYSNKDLRRDTNDNLHWCWDEI